jgi:3-oxoadipate enol-lactonase
MSMPPLRTRYRVEPCAGARAGQAPWLTLVTGIANDLTMWDPQVAAFTRDFRVLRYDLRGQGGTPATDPPYTIAQLVDDLVALWDEVAVGRTHLVGLGLGGALAQAAAIAHAERIDRLVPCCCRARMVPEFAALWLQLVETVRAHGIESIVEPTLQRWFPEAFRSEHPQVIDRVRAMIRATSVDGYLGCAGAFLGLDIEDELPRIRARALYVSGADDARGGPPALMQGLAARVPGARHVSVPGASHIANIHEPAGFNRALVAFLTEA